MSYRCRTQATCYWLKSPLTSPASKSALFSQVDPCNTLLCSTSSSRMAACRSGCTRKRYPSETSPCSSRLPRVPPASPRWSSSCMLCSTPRFVIQFCLLRLPLRRDCLSRLFSLCLSSASSSSICTPPPGPVASDTTAEQVQHLMLDAQVEAFMPPPGQDVYAQKVASAGSCRCPSVSLASSSDSSSSLMSVSLAFSSDSSL